ncbi:Sodium- and chloride-dependent glycine like protein [Argiope bruennichi]|uniref:Sodium-dependent nutrient amino acid transporter 1 n=1 Tax=Argiope bruennichi TaxID=94029 RepID=A0A8T0FJB0_ARGBR|nr:Sodium- and chloride-dependent glycine like protein [Argiope bruennichi]
MKKNRSSARLRLYCWHLKEFGMFETAVSAFVDEYPSFLQKRKTLFTAFLCILMFLLGLPCVTQGGIYVVQLMDWYSAAFSLMVISLLETVAVAWIYGVDRFLHDIFLMTRKRPSSWWKIYWSIGIGWIIAMCSITPIPVVAAVTLFREKGSFKERLIKSLRPSSDWGPALEENRIQYRKSLSIVSSRFYQKYTEQVPTLVKDIDVEQDEHSEACPFRTETAL